MAEPAYKGGVLGSGYLDLPKDFDLGEYFRSDADLGKAFLYSNTNGMQQDLSHSLGDIKLGPYASDAPGIIRPKTPQIPQIPSTLAGYDDQMKSVGAEYLSDPKIMQSLVEGRQNLMEGSSKGWLSGLNLDSIAKGIGFDNAESMKGVGGALGDVAGFGNMLYGMYNQNQMLDLAKDQYGFQKDMAQKQWNEAMKDKAEFKANRSAATKAYYGQ